jgi:hypothetical protein
MQQQLADTITHANQTEAEGQYSASAICLLFWCLNTISMVPCSSHLFQIIVLKGDHC